MMMRERGKKGGMVRERRRRRKGGMERGLWQTGGKVR